MKYLIRLYLRDKSSSVFFTCDLAGLTFRFLTQNMSENPSQKRSFSAQFKHSMLKMAFLNTHSGESDSQSHVVNHRIQMSLDWDDDRSPNVEQANHI